MTGAAGSVTLRETISVDEFAEMLQQRGFRAEIAADENKGPIVRSASSGVPFHVRFGNRATGTAERFVDLSLVMAAQLDVDLPKTFESEWNAGRRFARVHAHERLLVLELDVLLAGGVADAFLHAHLEIWDRLLQDLLMALRRIAPDSTQPAGS